MLIYSVDVFTLSLMQIRVLYKRSEIKDMYMP